MKGGQRSLVGPSGKLSAEGRKSWVEAEPQGHMFLLGWGGSSGQGQTVAAGCPHWESAGGTLCSRCAGVQVSLGRALSHGARGSAQNPDSCSWGVWVCTAALDVRNLEKKSKFLMSPTPTANMGNVAWPHSSCPAVAWRDNGASS